MKPKVILTTLISNTIKQKFAYGNTSGTVTAFLHQEFSKYLREVLPTMLPEQGINVYITPEWRVPDDAFGGTFDVDLAVHIVKQTDESQPIKIFLPDQITDGQLTRLKGRPPSFAFLLKFIMQTFNKNRFNNACSEIGEAARISFRSSREPSGLKTLFVKFIAKEAFWVSKGNVYTEKTETLDTNSIISKFHVTNNEGVIKTGCFSVWVKYDLSKNILRLADGTHSEDGFKVRVATEKSLLDIDQKSVDDMPLLTQLKTVIPEEFRRGGYHKNYTPSDPL